MSYNKMFGTGECTAQRYAFEILWLQHRNIEGIIEGENDIFSWFYCRQTQREGMALLPDGRLTMKNNYGPDERFMPADFINLRKEGESLHEWSQRMQREYPWENYLIALNEYGRQHIIEKYLARQKIVL